MRRGEPGTGYLYQNEWSTSSASSAKRSAAVQNGTTESNGSSPARALPGRPRRRTPIPVMKKRKKSLLQRIRLGRKLRLSTLSSLVLAVVLWYLLGVISIATSKLLLDPNHIGVPALFLTLQQLVLGSSLLRFLLHMRFMGSPGLVTSLQTFNSSRYPHRQSHLHPQPHMETNSFWKSLTELHLVAAGIFFTLGFLTTNLAFHGSTASFVETIKAAEPITSASVAVWWKIETLGSEEVLSLVSIVTGVVLSTLANAHSQHSSSVSLAESVQSCFIVMTSNLCFSFRGLYQKLFRAITNAQVLDDLNLQFRMQQLGVVLLVLPVLLLDAPGMLSRLWKLSLSGSMIGRYLSLAILNGFAFTSYNLASTYILSRISVVHHAALNCIRRIFAIVVTSIVFGVPITLMGLVGILISFVGFMAFTHYKTKRQRQPKPVSPLLPVSASFNGQMDSSV